MDVDWCRSGNNCAGRVEFGTGKKRREYNEVLVSKNDIKYIKNIKILDRRNGIVYKENSGAKKV